MIVFGLWNEIRSWGWSPVNGISALLSRDRVYYFRLLSTMWGHYKKSLGCKPGRGSYQNPTILAPWSLSSQPPELWYKFLSNLVTNIFVTAAQATIPKWGRLQCQVLCLQTPLRSKERKMEWLWKVWRVVSWARIPFTSALLLSD